MITASATWTCEPCGIGFTAAPGAEPVVCPRCASGAEAQSVRASDDLRVSFAEHVVLRQKDPSLPSKQKLRRELRTGERLEGSGSGRIVSEHRLIDRDADQYSETIIAADGTTIREHSEPLSTHRGGTEETG